MPVIHDCEQNSPEWFALRLGIPTASEFKTVLAKGKGAAPSKTRATYLHKLAGERITGQPMDNYTNHHIERGKLMEDEARDLYAFMNDVEVRQVGFIAADGTGCSPDGLIGEDGMLEVKTALPHIMVDLIMHDRFPSEHVAQVQGQLWIAERQWCDLVVFWPGLPLFVKRLKRDDDYIGKLATAVGGFETEIRTVVDRVRAYGAPTAARVSGEPTLDPAPAQVDATDLASAPPVF